MKGFLFQSLTQVFIASLLFLTIVSPVYAKGNAMEMAQAHSESEMSEIVVTATRYEEEVQHIPANVSVITEEDIKNSTAQNMPELLRTQVGVKVNDINGSRRSYTVDLRAFGETAGLNTLVLVDGRKVNQVDLSTTDWTQIPLDRVKRIEIIRGGRGSVFYGDNATGGVINIITKEGEEFRAAIEGSAGSYDTYKGNAAISGTASDFSYAISGSYFDSEGYRDNSDIEAKDIGLNLNYYVGRNVRLNVSGSHHEENTGLPGALFESELQQGLSRTDSTHPDDFTDVEDYYVKAGTEISLWENSRFKIDASFRQRNLESFSSFSGGEFTGDTEIETVAVSPQLLLKNTFGKAQNSLTIGIDYEKAEEDIVNSSIFFGSPSLGEFDLEKKSYGYYAFDDFVPAEGLSLSFGYRYDKADFDFDPTIVLPAGIPTSPSSTSVDEDAYTGGVNYTFYGKSYAYFSYARSFRYPVLDEFFSFFTNTIDEGLKPQRSDNYELGVRHYFSDSIYAHLNLFKIDTEDEIFYNQLNFANENLDGKTQREGVEISFKAGVTEWLFFNGSYTYVDAQIEEGQFKGNDVPDVPNHKATLGAAYSWNKASFALNGLYVGERPFVSDFSNTFGDQDDYFVLNAKIKYTWKRLTAFLDINNVTDKEYAEYGVIGFNTVTFQNEKAFYPSPERNFLFGVSIDI